MKGRILIVEDEETLRRVLTTLLTGTGYEVLAVPSGEAALERAPACRPDVGLIDLRLSGRDGLETMKALREALAPDEPVFIMMTAHGTIRSAVDAMKHGALDYITKPFDNDELQLVLERALEKRRLERRVEALESQLDQQFRPDSMIAVSPAMDAVFRMIQRVAPLDTSILITGESGTGKELVARAIHRHSGRSGGPFVPIDCGAIPETLIESTFFGHEKGAFTDARKAARGAFEQAHGGTLFLDEVGQLSAAAQASLLRVLQEHEVRRVGGERIITVDVRVIAATNRDIRGDVREGRFREDLDWRLNVVGIELPPLRERPEDIPALAEHFVAKHAARLGLPPRPLAPDALSLLLGWHWPGNVRELENAIEHALALATGHAIVVADLPPRLRGAGASPPPASAPPDGHPAAASRATLPETIARAQVALEERMIRDALRETGGNRTLAADLLGVSRKTLFNKMRELEIG